MILLPDNDPILREVQPIYTGNPADLKDIAHEMLNFMFANRGMGLAAPQVGLRLRMFVMKNGNKGFKHAHVCINPEIMARSLNYSTAPEACLTFPGCPVRITRPASVHVKAMNLRGQFVIGKLSGLDARCFQHELDHLDGKLIADPVTRTTAIGASP